MIGTENSNADLREKGESLPDAKDVRKDIAPTEDKKKRRWLSEYSKQALFAVIVLWFVVALWGCILITLQFLWYEILDLNSILVYVGTPMGGGLATYLIKSAMENKEKIKGSIQNVMGGRQYDYFMPGTHECDDYNSPGMDDDVISNDIQGIGVDIDTDGMGGM